jgi:hypothetical protein
MMGTRFKTLKQRRGPSFPQAMEKLREGETLTLEFFSGQPRWELCGREVPIETVAMLLASREVVADPDALFDGALAQTWRVRS